MYTQEKLYIVTKNNKQQTTTTGRKQKQKTKKEQITYIKHYVDTVYIYTTYYIPKDKTGGLAVNLVSTFPSALATNVTLSVTCFNALNEYSKPFA